MHKLAQGLCTFVVVMPCKLIMRNVFITLQKLLSDLQHVFTDPVHLKTARIDCQVNVPSMLAEDLWRPILQLEAASTSYPLSGAVAELEEPLLVPTQLDNFLLELPRPLGEEVEPLPLPRDDELELLRVCKNKKHALTPSRGDNM